MQSLRRRVFLLIEVLANRQCGLCLSAVAGFVFFRFPVLAMEANQAQFKK